MGAIPGNEGVDRSPEPAATDESERALGLGWTAVLQPRARGGAVLRITHPEQGSLAVEIAITAQGPVIRASAAALEIEAPTEIHARCARFIVDARESLELRAPEITQRATGALRLEGQSVDVQARAGDVRLQANDDVQLLGEQVLLNCEREAPPPAWLPQAAPAEITVPRADSAGDLALFAELPKD